MGRGAGAADFAARDREAAVNFGEAARDAGVERVDLPRRARRRRPPRSTCARATRSPSCCASACPQLVYVRAAMIIGAGQRVVRDAARTSSRRLPVMITPRWLDTRTQPVAIADVVADAGRPRPSSTSAPAEVQLGGADVLTYREMMPPHRGRARPPRSPIVDPGAAAHATPVLLLGRARHAGRDRARAPAGRRAAARRWSCASRRRRGSTTARSASTKRCGAALGMKLLNRPRERRVADA